LSSRAAAETPATRRLVIVVGAVLFVDTLLYTAIAPILPQLAQSLHLSKAAAGVMSGSYAAGTLLASVPGGMLATRIGSRRTLQTGLALLASSTIAFALLNNAVLIDAARFVEGIGGACAWAGGLALIVAETSAANRGVTIGQVISAGIAGILCGPIVGTFASVAGRPAAFAIVGVIAGLVALSTRSLGPERRSPPQSLGALQAAVTARPVVVGAWVVALPSVAGGLINVLAPLRLHQLGASSVAIGAVFVAAAVLRALIAPRTGRVSDRHGRRIPLACGLAVLAAGVALLTVPVTPLWLGVTVAISFLGLGVSSAPAMALLSDASEAQLLAPGFGAALMNLAWAGGQVTGSGLGGALAARAGDALPTVIAAVLCATTAAVIAHGMRRTY
jgi:MFS family permease